MFSVAIVDNKTASAIFKEMAECIILPGRAGELSILDFHQPLVACLQEGLIQIMGKPSIRIKKGIVRVEKNELVALVER